MNEAILALLIAHAAPQAVEPAKLAHEIMVVSKQYNADPELLTRIILVESRGIANAYNSHSADHGLMQINSRTARAYGIPHSCLYDWKCNLRAGARLVAKLRRPCHYNTGAVGAKKYPKQCLRYEKNLANL